MKAHQRAIREQMVGADVLAGRWQPEALDIGQAQVRPISFTQARELIEVHEYLGTMPAVVSHCFGLFFGDRLGGAVVYGPEYGENLGVWDRYGFTGQIIALKRGACAHWAHPHSASKLIRGSMRLLPARCRIITATVDAAAGEIGTVYQACGFVYVGPMHQGTRRRVHDGDRSISERSARRRYGTSSGSALAALGLTVEQVPRPARYFAFRGTQTEQKGLLAAIADKVQPYPKRSAVVVNFTGRAAEPVGGKNGSVGFIKTRRRLLKDGDISTSFDLVRAVRVEGKPSNVFVAALGAQRADDDSARFWQRATERMVAAGLSAQQRQRLVAGMIAKGARPAA